MLISTDQLWQRIQTTTSSMTCWKKSSWCGFRVKPMHSSKLPSASVNNHDLPSCKLFYSWPTGINKAKQDVPLKAPLENKPNLKGKWVYYQNFSQPIWISCHVSLNENLLIKNKLCSKSSIIICVFLALEKNAVEPFAHEAHTGVIWETFFCVFFVFLSLCQNWFCPHLLLKVTEKITFWRYLGLQHRDKSSPIPYST